MVWDGTNSLLSLEPDSFPLPTSLQKSLASPVTNAISLDTSARTANSINAAFVTIINPAILLTTALTTKMALPTWGHPQTMNPMVTTKAFMAMENSRLKSKVGVSTLKPEVMLWFCHFSCHHPPSVCYSLFVYMHYGTTFVVDIYFSLFVMFTDFYDVLYCSV